MLVDEDIKIESDDSESEDEIEDHVSGQGRLAFRMKKFWATKVATSKAGRKAIYHFLGQEGVTLLRNLQSAIAKSTDKKQSERIVKIILLLAFKMKLLFDENQLTLEDTKVTITPINDCVIRLNDALHAEKLEEGPMKLLAAKFNLLEELVTKILRPLIKPKNVRMFQEVVQFLGDPKFLDQICNQEAFRAEKKVLGNSIETLIKPLLEQRGLLESGGPDPCSVPGCDGEGCMKDIGGKFRGSRLCPRHHLLMYKELTSKPPVAVHFVLGEGKDYEPYVRLVGQHLPAFYSRFYAAMYNFRRESYGIMRLPSNKARKLFAEAMFEKFLESNAPCPVDIPDEVKNRVRSVLRPSSVGQPQEEKKELDNSLYDECYELVEGRIQTLFMERFGGTPHWQAYVEAITMPPRLLEAAEAGMSRYRPKPPTRRPEPTLAEVPPQAKTPGGAEAASAVSSSAEESSAAAAAAAPSPPVAPASVDPAAAAPTAEAAD